MSADLFAAFGQTDQAQNPTSEGSQERSTAAPTRTPGDSISGLRDSSHKPIFQPSNDGGNEVLFDATAEQGERDDDFGDFEDVETYQTSSTEPAVSHRIAEAARPSSNDYENVSAREKEATLLDLLSIDDTPTQVSFQPHRHTEDPTSAFDLFDARSNAPDLMPKMTSPPMQRQVDDDDVWGDFEAVPTQPAAPSPSHPRVHAHPAASVDQPNLVNAPRPPAPPPPNEADDWDTFEDSPATPNPASHPPASSASKHTSISTSSIPTNAQRPTNVPPPSILLSLLPTTFSSLLALILSTSEPCPPSDSHPTHAIPTEDLPILIQTTYRTSTRIISTPARTLRWRRDNLLSQSTRIGVAGKAGGMKLSSLNKSESVREEREAAEALESWNGKIHNFSRVLQNSGVKLQSRLKLSMNAPVKPLTGAGVIQATLVCPVCGLKRSERLVGFEEGVEDVFGEYWLENWGHRDCAEWWYRWSSELGQR